MVRGLPATAFFNTTVEVIVKRSLLVFALGTFVAATAHAEQSIPNPLINYEQFQRIVTTSRTQREEHRLTEAQFIGDMQRKDVVVLDARSEARFRLRHVKGAVNLPFTEFTATSLARVVPDKDTTILIYCNNNFLDSPVAFATKMPAASLNLATYTSLKAYGYTNIFELGPLLRIEQTRIPFEGSDVEPR